MVNCFFSHIPVLNMSVGWVAGKLFSFFFSTLPADFFQTPDESHDLNEQPPLSLGGHMKSITLTVLESFVIICERDWTLKSENESPILQTYTAGPKQSISLKPSGSCKWTLDCLEEPPQANSSSFKICESKLWVTKTHCWIRKSCSDILLCKKEDYKELRGKMNHRFLSRQVYFTCVDTQRLNKDSTIWLGSRWSRFAVIRHPAAAACAASVITCERAALMKVHVFVLVCRSRWVGPDKRSRYKL